MIEITISGSSKSDRDILKAKIINMLLDERPNDTVDFGRLPNVTDIVLLQAKSLPFSINSVTFIEKGIENNHEYGV